MVSPYMLRSRSCIYYALWLLTTVYVIFVCPGWFRKHPKITEQRLTEREQHQERIGFAPATGVKNILLWTSYYGSPSWDHDALGMKPFRHELCHMHCYATKDRRYLSQADAILFNYADVNLDDWPENVTSRQIMILVIHEPPSEVGVNLYKYEGRFQFVMSYRRDSEIYAPYRTIKPVGQSMGDYAPRVPLGNRTKTAVWISDDCTTPSQRERYVRELAKYINVDIYGKCGTHQCPEDKCMDIFEANYKFYLAFESSICKDYVTDNMFQTLRWDIVPVVLGGANYAKETINSAPAVIDAMEFPNPKSLAKQLTFLTYSEERYNKYFVNKLRYRILETNGPLTAGLCKLCDWLYNRKSSDEFPFRSDLAVWWNADTCHNEYMSEQHRTW